MTLEVRSINLGTQYSSDDVWLNSNFRRERLFPSSLLGESRERVWRAKNGRSPFGRFLEVGEKMRGSRGNKKANFFFKLSEKRRISQFFAPSRIQGTSDRRKTCHFWCNLTVKNEHFLPTYRSFTHSPIPKRISTGPAILLPTSRPLRTSIWP